MAGGKRFPPDLLISILRFVILILRPECLIEEFSSDATYYGGAFGNYRGDYVVDDDFKMRWRFKLQFLEITAPMLEIS